MPKSTAIKLSRKTVSRISDELRIPEKSVETELNHKEVIYYVKDCFFNEIPMPYLIYRKKEFLENFASVPPGIEERFVPVTQVKDQP